MSTVNMLGDIQTSTSMDGNITATATVTNNTNINGELTLETTLRITAVVASTVTCRHLSGGQASIGFTVSGTCTYAQFSILFGLYVISHIFIAL